MLKYVGLILLIVGLASFAGMSLMEGSIVYRSQLLEHSPPIVFITKKNGTISSSLPPCRTFYVSSCFKVSRLEGVEFYLDLGAHIPPQHPPVGGIWGYVLDCSSPIGIAQNMSQFLDRFHLMKVRLRPTSAAFTRGYGARISLENLTEREIFVVVYGRLKAQQNQSCVFSEPPVILAVAHPSRGQKVRVLYLTAAGALLLVLHHVRNPDEFRRSVDRLKKMIPRSRRRSSPP